MAVVPAGQKIYHITHLRNLPQIVMYRQLWSDAKRMELKLDSEVVGISAIKRRRLEGIEVSCHPGTKVGHYVPFYFCPRSIMLYILHKGNHPDLNYADGQKPMVHLQADLRATIEWADNSGIKWAFSNRNAGTWVADFFSRSGDLNKVNWAAVAATDFRDPVVKEGKQAEFLMFEAFPWALVESIGVMDRPTRKAVADSMAGADHQPPVGVEREWYY